MNRLLSQNMVQSAHLSPELPRNDGAFGVLLNRKSYAGLSGLSVAPNVERKVSLQDFARDVSEILHEALLQSGKLGEEESLNRLMLGLSDLLQKTPLYESNNGNSNK